jgi:hypothetical protein
LRPKPRTKTWDTPCFFLPRAGDLVHLPEGILG